MTYKEQIADYQIHLPCKKPFCPVCMQYVHIMYVLEVEAKQKRFAKLVADEVVRQLKEI